MKAKDRRALNKLIQQRDDPSEEELAYREFEYQRQRERQEELRRRKVRYEQEHPPTETTR